MATQRTKPQLVTAMAASAQAAALGLLDFSVGSILRALVDAVADVVMWLQGLALRVLSLTRAATSRGPDLDSWMADFSFVRLTATYAVGDVTFSRFTTTGSALVPVGARVETADGSRAFAVVADPTVPQYSVGQNGYVLAAGVPAITVPVQALETGTAGNVMQNTVTVIGSAIPGVDRVNNPADFADGTNDETDEEFRLRFQGYLDSLGGATESAILSAIRNAGIGISAVAVDNERPDGTPELGFFYVVVDDGSGSPPQEFLDEIALIVDRERPFGSQFDVLAPILLNAVIVVTAQADSGYSPSGVDADITAALSGHIAGLGMGEPLYLTKLYQLAWNVPGVANVSSITINGGGADIIPTFKEIVRSNSISVTVS